MRRICLVGAAALLTLCCAQAVAATPLRIATSVTPSPSRFGDVVHATLVVRAAGPATVQPGFSPFAVLDS